MKNIDPGDLIYPLFVKEGEGLREEIPSMKGVFRMSPDVIVREAGELREKGVDKVLIFGVPGKKDETGSAACHEKNIVAETVRRLKNEIVGETVFTDVCLCAYTSHGHCGIVKNENVKLKNEKLIDSEATLAALAKMAFTHAEAGADYVAPSAMAEGQVGYIRRYLDDNGYGGAGIMGYSAKFASSAYGPFRDIADSAPRFGDRRSYQLDHRDSFTALAEIENDIREGADIVMVKPSLWYLDIIKEARAMTSLPLAAYNVSGEYAMVKNGALASFWNEREMVFEVLNSIKRAGADLIITYHAKDVAGWL